MKYDKAIAIQLTSILFVFLIFALWVHEAKSGDVINCQGAMVPCIPPIPPSVEDCEGTPDDPKHCTLGLYCPDPRDCGTTGYCYDAGYITGKDCYEWGPYFRCAKIRCDCVVTEGFKCKFVGVAVEYLDLICPDLVDHPNIIECYTSS